MTNTNTIIILLGSLIFFTTLISFSIIFLLRRYKKNRLWVNIISDGGYKERFSIHQENATTTIKNKYIFRNENILNTARGKEIYYIKDNPEPLKFSREGIMQNNDVLKNKINAVNLKSIIETELIAKLFKKEVFNTENLLLIINIGVSLFAVVLLFIIKSQGVNIDDTEANKLFIQNAVRSALLG